MREPWVLISAGSIRKSSSDSDSAASMAWPASAAGGWTDRKERRRTMNSIYERALGSDFSRLHPKIQQRFGFSSVDGLACIGRGVMDRSERAETNDELNL